METSPIQVTVDEFTVQYILKDERTDMPKPLPMKTFSVDLEVDIPDDLAKFVSEYSKVKASGEDGERAIPIYVAPKETVKRWRAWLQKYDPDSFSDIKMLSPDQVIDAAISCSIEDTITDSLGEVWDSQLANSLGAIPEVPEGFRIHDRFIHLKRWHVKED